MTEIQKYEHSTEIVELDGRVVTRTDLRNAATDSCTSVLTEVGQLAQIVSQTDLVPKVIQGNAAATGARILYGREVGLGPMQALTQLHNVDGRVGMSAEAMRALVLQHGHEIVVTESTSARVEVKGRRTLGPEPENTAQKIDAARARSALARVNEAARRSAAVTERRSIERTSPGWNL